MWFNISTFYPHPKYSNLMIVISSSQIYVIPWNFDYHDSFQAIQAIMRESQRERLGTDQR